MTHDPTHPANYPEHRDNRPTPHAGAPVAMALSVPELRDVLAIVSAARDVVRTWTDPLDDDVHGAAVAALDRALAAVS